MIRLFVQAELSEAARVPVGADQAHYLVNVMRLQPGPSLAPVRPSQMKII